MIMKLTHLEHIEDNLMEIPGSVLNTLEALGDREANVSLKWDGSPAIIFGIDPFTMKFFLSTKALFNKTPKINYSCDDIMVNHGDSYELCTKLMYVFSIIKPRYTDSCIVQADLLFTKNDISITSDQYVRFTPNTLTYEVRGSESALAKNALMGLVIHTKYLFTRHDATSLQDLVAFPYKYTGTMGNDIWIARTTVNTDIADNDVDDAVSAIKRLISKRDQQFVQTKIIDSGTWVSYKRFYNHCIRTNDRETSHTHFDIHWKKFSDWVIDRGSNKVKTLKSHAGMKSWLYELDRELSFVHDPKVIEHFKDHIFARDYVTRFKTDFCRSLQMSGSAIARYNDEPCGHEGYVITNPVDGAMMKIVNRREFSMRNFNNNGS